MALLTLLYDSEIWTLSSKDFSKIQAVEIKFLRSVKCYIILDKVRNEDTRKELEKFWNNSSLRTISKSLATSTEEALSSAIASSGKGNVSFFYVFSPSIF